MTRAEAIKILMGYCHTSQERAALEVLIPELTESEDERIRKAIIGIIKNSNVIDINVSHERMLAYLEKQKEQRPISFYGHYNPDDYEVVVEGNATSLKKKEQKPVDYEAELKKCKDNPLYFYDKYVSIKLKPAKWSEEDEEMLQSIIKDFRAGKVSTIGQEQWLKSLHPSWKPSEEQMEALLNAEGFLRAGLQHDSAKTIADLYEQLKKL